MSELRMDDDFLSEMLGDFLDETDEIVVSLYDNLLKLDEWVRTLDPGQVARCDDDRVRVTVPMVFIPEDMGEDHRDRGHEAYIYSDRAE